MAVTTARFVLNEATLNEVQTALASGLLDMGEQLARDAAARVHRATDPYHLADHWGAAVYVDGKKIKDVSADGTATNKPRAFQTEAGPTAIVGFGFVARFHELGTSDTPAEPFLSPAFQSVANHAAEIMRVRVAPYWPKRG